MNSLLSRISGAAVSACLLLPATAFAAGGEQTPLDLDAPASKVKDAAAAVPGSSGSGSLVRTIVGLAVVLGVIYGLHWILKQVKAAKDDQHTGSSLESLSSLPLGANRSLHLVRVGTDLVLVGVGEHGVTPIRAYTESEALIAGLIEERVEDVIDVAAHAAPAKPSLAARMIPPSFLPKPGTAVVRASSAPNRLVEGLRARTVIRK